MHTFTYPTKKWVNCLPIYSRSLFGTLCTMYTITIAGTECRSLHGLPG